MENTNSWLPLESDPDSLNAFLQKLGQNKLKFADILGFQDDVLALTPQPVYAVLLLYPPCDEKTHVTTEETKSVPVDHDVWFIKQTIKNACGTIALLHLLANMKKRFPLENDSVADLFFKKVQDMTPDDRAKELEKNQDIQAIHQSFAESGVTTMGDVANVETHYIVFLEVNGHLYELDGRNQKPIAHGVTNRDNLLKDAAKIIEKNFIPKDSSEHRFSALALTTALAA